MFGPYLHLQINLFFFFYITRLVKTPYMSHVPHVFFIHLVVLKGYKIHRKFKQTIVCKLVRKWSKIKSEELMVIQGSHGPISPFYHNRRSSFSSKPTPSEWKWTTHPAAWLLKSHLVWHQCNSTFTDRSVLRTGASVAETTVSEMFTSVAMKLPGITLNPKPPRLVKWLIHSPLQIRILLD